MNKVKITMFLIFGLCMNINAQPQWKFHVAYEDATGARDTIWFIWDTTATFYGLDTALGEVPVSPDPENFNVWTLSWDIYPEFDTVKVIAHPYTYDFGHSIRAINFELPITIRWDSSLLHADWLPPEPVGWVNVARLANDYFFLVTNNPPAHEFDMTLDDHVMAPDTNITNPWFWHPERHFPMSVILTQDPAVGKPDIKYLHEITVTLFPNPVINTLYIKTDNQFDQAQIFNMNGKTFFTNLIQNEITTIDVSTLAPGIYIIHLFNNHKQHYYEKFIKAD